MTHLNSSINNLAEILVTKGIKHVVISPGSRNAPLIIELTQHPELNCLSIVDERSAGFYALGIAQQSRIPTVLVCTSGSAVLNYGPAIAEAFYQEIPLIIITADRPEEWIDQSDGQTIKQQDVYKNYCKASFSLPQGPQDQDSMWHSDFVLNKAINFSTQGQAGPVHINVPFKEPLYVATEKEKQLRAKIIDITKTDSSLDEEIVFNLSKQWNSFSKKMVLVGMMPHNDQLHILTDFIAKDDSVALLTERTSNVKNPAYVDCIDRIFWNPDEEQSKALQPELLVTFGKNIISKKIKTFLRKYPPKEHWHICPETEHLDTFKSLTKIIPLNPVKFLKQLCPYFIAKKSEYRQIFAKADYLMEIKHQKFISVCEFSDLLAFESIINLLPENSNVHLGNSTPVRYAQLFKTYGNLCFNSNRGTSGIDGVISTAAGAAFFNKNMPTVVICGDLSFVYDSNSLWNKNLTPNLKIIVINNEGGSIFRFLEGPNNTGLMEEFFETNHPVKNESIVNAFNLNYYLCSSKEELDNTLPEFYRISDKPSVLEIKTQKELNIFILNNYFKFITAK